VRAPESVFEPDTWLAELERVGTVFETTSDSEVSTT
jgi:hypothetical protein